MRDQPAAILATMSQTPQPGAPASTPFNSAGGLQRKQRAPRVKLRGSVLLLIRLPNQREVPGSLHQLSINGGMLHLETPLDEKLKVELIFHLGETTIREKAEIMFPMWATQGWHQPFRFVDMPETSKYALHTALQAFVQYLSEQSC